MRTARRSLALDGTELPVYASKDNRREWIHAVDHRRTVEAVIERGRIGETYHVGTGDEASVERIADLVPAELGLPSSLKTTVPDRPGHDRRYLLDSTKIRRELGWEPTVAFEDGVRDTIRWYAANRAWWEPSRDRSPVAERSAWSR